MLLRQVGKLLVCGAMLCAAQLSAPQAASLKTPQAALKLDGGEAALDGPWKFHLGDDLAWASPELDDSSWENLTVDKPWGMQGHANTEGYAWYRRRVTLDAGLNPPQTLAILLPAVEDAYEIYWNGRLVGTYGKLPPHPVYYFDQRPRTFDLGPPEAGVLAVRVWKAPFVSFDSGLQGGFRAPPLVGSRRAIRDALRALDYSWLRSRMFTFGFNALYLLVGLLSLIAWLRDRRQQVVFWMACFALCQPFLLLEQGTRLPLSEMVGNLLSTLLYIASDIALWNLLLWFLDLRDDRKLVRLVYIVAAVDLADGLVDSFTTWMYGLPNPAPAQIADGVCTVVLTGVEVIPFILIGLALARRKRLTPARWAVALFAFLTQVIVTFSYAFLQGSRFTHWTLGATIAAPLFSVAGSSITAANIAEILLLIALVYAVYQYSVESGKRQTALEQEYKNARAVQQVLIPEAIPAVAGFVIESVYKPAGDVGGDFFQILAARDGGVLAVIGDVSGKGMPAAMTVSLLVGTVRTLAHYTESPGEILAAMNQRMLGRSQGGFTTCLVLRADADGKLTVANAGHIAPYLDGKELAVESGLPLGLAAAGSYTEATFALSANAQLTLVTDGVVEARDKSGELFGFEKTAAISMEAAETIAQRAQEFGQDDDITVLTLQRTVTA